MRRPTGPFEILVAALLLAVLSIGVIVFVPALPLSVHIVAGSLVSWFAAPWVADAIRSAKPSSHHRRRA